MPIHGMSTVKLAVKNTRVNANDGIKKEYIKGLTAVVKGTPVDNGRARNNWFLTVGSPSRSMRAPSKGGNGSFSSIGRLPKSILNKKVFFSNNLPYINTLEYGGYPSPVRLGTWDKRKKRYIKKSKGGFSKQVAPRGWVRIALAHIKKGIRKL